MPGDLLLGVPLEELRAHCLCASHPLMHEVSGDLANEFFGCHGHPFLGVPTLARTASNARSTCHHTRLLLSITAPLTEASVLPAS